MTFQRQMDYVDVATRLQEMREKFPDLTMSQVKMEFVEVAGKPWVVYTAAAYRTPDDPRPGIGTAWEPIPGPTNFTKDSEVQNAETAAWGRALIAIGASTKNGIASAEEITNRSGPVQHESRTSAPVSDDIATILKGAELEPDNEFLNSLAGKFHKYGKLTDNQIGSGVTAALRIIGSSRPPDDGTLLYKVKTKISSMTAEQKDELSKLWEENGLPSLKSELSDEQISTAEKVVNFILQPSFNPTFADEEDRF